MSASEDGWQPAQVGADALQWVTVPGTNVHLQIMKGWPLAVMAAVAADFNAYIEPLRDADSASWTPTNSVATSNHLNGTAMDLNWDSHKFHVRGTFTAAQMVVVRELLDFYEGTIFWAGDWDDPVDEMHWQMGYGTWNNPQVGDFISRKIRADGFSTFRRQTAPPVNNPLPPVNSGADAVATLSQAMGGEVSLDRYRQLLPAISAALTFCECTTVDRVAMWMAQLGEESGGLQWMEELASGAEYEGRSDLGNTHPGDGARFKGRGPIQITGRANYTSLSMWAYTQSLVPSATFFVDQPEQLASDQYGFVGVDWYWTVARPMNSYADRADVLGATKAVNGGTHGLQDRTDRWNRCRAMGQQLLTLTTTGDDMTPEQEAKLDRCLFLMEQQTGIRRPSLSAFRHVGEGDVNTCGGFAWSADGSTHVALVERLAVEYGDPTSVALLMEVAAADPVKHPDRVWDAKLAARLLTKVSDTAKADATAQIKAWLAAEAVK